MTAGPVTVDACHEGCGGIFFDALALSKVATPGSPGREALLSISLVATAPDAERRRHCPRCVRVVLARRFYSVLRRVQVDECPTCGGVWLDAGELLRIQGELSSKKGGRVPTGWEPPRVDDALGPLGIVGGEVLDALARAVSYSILR
jgi:hypothetical protein